MIKRISIAAILTALTFVIVSCGEEGSGKKDSSIIVKSEAPADKCEEGGVEINVGIDSNADGKLDKDEIAATDYICNGQDGTDGKNGVDGKDGAKGDKGDAGDDGQHGKNGIDGQDGAKGEQGDPGSDGKNVLLKTSDEPAGSNCVVGGKKVETGIDDNGNGQLDPEEVDETTYICDGENGQDGQDGAVGNDGKNALAKVTEEPAGTANCNGKGGQKIETGIDTSGEGKLDDGEVTDTTYVCNGEKGDTGAAGDNGKNALVKITEEATGTANCSGKGGQKIETGIDISGEGDLDDVEVTDTTYVCNGGKGATGDTGQDGKNGLNSVTNITDEPNGTENCNGNGGKKIETGVDDNNNGKLDEGEADSTSYICNAEITDHEIYRGSVTLRDAADIEKLKNYKMIDGSLIIHTESLSALTLDNLLVVSDTLQVIGNTALTEITFSELRSVGGNGLMITENTALKTVSFPKLEIVTGSASMGGQEVKSIIHRSRGNISSNGAINISRNLALTTIDMPELTSVLGGASLEISGNDELINISMPKLKEIYNGTIYENSKLENLDGFAGLEKLYGRISITRNNALKSVQAISNISGGNCYLRINNNVSLPECDVRLLEYRLVIEKQISARVATFDNDETGVCEVPGFCFGYFELNGTKSDIPEGCDKVVGGINISDEALIDTPRVKALSVIFGVLTVDSSGLTSLSMPNLTVVKSVRVANNSSLTSLEFPLLENVEDSVTMENNSVLSSVKMDKLAVCGQNFTNANNAELAELIIPLLKEVSYFNSSNNAKLMKISAPELLKVDNIRIYGNPLLKTMETTKLETIYTVEVVLNAALENLNGISGLRFVKSDININSNASLTSIEGLHHITKVGDGRYPQINVMNNSKLPKAAAEAFIEYIKSTGWSGSSDVSGNLE